MFRDVTTKDLGPKAKKAQKLLLEEIGMAGLPPAKLAANLRRLAALEKRFQNIGILKPGQKIPTKVAKPDPKKDHLRPGGDNPKDPDAYKLTKKKKKK